MIPGAHDIIDKIVQQAALYAVPLYNRQVIKWIKELKRLESPSEFKKLSRLTPKLESLFYQAIIVAYLIGNGVVQKEIAFQEGAARDAKILRFAETPFKIITGIFSKFPAAEKAFSIKNAVDYEAYKEIMGWAKSLAFSLARVDNMSAVNAVKKSLEDSFKDGQTFREWRKNLNQVFEAGGWTPLAPWHAETVFRTNLMKVYAAGKYEFCQGADNVIAYEYSAVMDDRTRPEHRAMNGKVYPKDSSIWNDWFPPCDYNCRCTVIPITRSYADENNLTINRTVPKAADGGVGESFKGGGPTLANYNKSLQEAI